MTFSYQDHETRRRCYSRLACIVAAAALCLGAYQEALAQDDMTCTDEEGRRICSVNQGAGTLTRAIAGDTTATGARVDSNTVYVLQRGGVYLLDGSIENSGYPLVIEAEEGEGERPRLIPAVATGGEAERAFTPRGDLTLRGLYVTNQDELGGLVLRIIRVRENNVRITIENTHLDRASQSAIRVDGTNIKIYIRSSIISNIGTADSPDNGRGIDDRGNDIDSVVVENTTFYNLTSRALRDGGGLINYARFDHNTFYNIGQFAVSFGPVQEAIFTNNQVINAGFYGNEPGDTRELVEVDSLPENPETQSVRISNNNFYRDPAIEATYPDTVTAVPNFGAAAEAYVQENGTGETMLAEAVEFTNAPEPATYILETYYADPAGPQEPWRTGLGPDDEIVDPSVDVMPFDFSYPVTAASYEASTAGQPLGDLTWFGMEIIPVSNEAASEVPRVFRLIGNYPNPFNPSTTIQFDLASPAEVSVVVFDVLGRQVMALPVRPMQAGADQALHVDASGLASGIYLYQVRVRVQDDVSVQAGRMILLK